MCVCHVSQVSPWDVDTDVEERLRQEEAARRAAAAAAAAAELARQEAAAEAARQKRRQNQRARFGECGAGRCVGVCCCDWDCVGHLGSLMVYNCSACF
jgi:hypothetical protein